MLILLQCPLDALLPTSTTYSPSPMLILPHPWLILSASKHAYACTVPSRYASDPTHPLASTPPTLTMLTLVECPIDMPPTPSPILELPHPQHLPCLHLDSAL
ncbi:hypothetical protein O181_031472 [Austropuccinia psidii MF-1]|uniref:Uncharacterized protein n=1 Tax=Austropuccinia psidii MF-1 TaxID=1389203 RepID=A0A9Q3H5D9_9BASI|nr:hypothetical protein [Austropuccinia psidii MF-1]